MSDIFASSFAAFILFPAMLVTAVVHIVFACAVLHDSRNYLRQSQRTIFLVPGQIWALATLAGGLMVVGIYWAIHHSALRPQPAVAQV